jgi:hypothetical protein
MREQYPSSGSFDNRIRLKIHANTPTAQANFVIIEFHDRHQCKSEAQCRCMAMVPIHYTTAAALDTNRGSPTLSGNQKINNLIYPFVKDFLMGRQCRGRYQTEFCHALSFSAVCDTFSLRNIRSG